MVKRKGRRYRERVQKREGKNMKRKKEKGKGIWRGEAR